MSRCVKAVGYGTFETLRRQNMVLRGTMELNSGIQLAVWYNDCDTVTVRSDHHTSSLYVADGYESYQRTSHSWKNDGGPDHFCPMSKGDESVWDIRGGPSFARLYCIDERLRRVGGEVRDRSPANFTLQEKTFTSDNKITVVYHQFSLTNDWRQPANQLTPSTTSSLLPTHLIQHYSIVQRRLPTVTGGLAPGVKRHVLTWIDAHLDQPLTLADLAQQTELSELHLACMPRQPLNIAPCQYAIQWQMVRVQNLPCHSALPLTGTVLVCGFSSASHFSHWVKATTDLTPSQLRAARRG